MKTIKCDRCGADIPYIPPYMNVANKVTVSPTIHVTTWIPVTQELKEVDLCNKCQSLVFDYIFNYKIVADP